MRKLLIVIAAVVAGGLITAAVAPFLFPADFYKARLARIVKERTGRDLRIEGSLRFSILPSIGLVAQRVTLSSPPGSFTSDFLRTGRLVGRIRLASLLHGAVQIDEVTLFDPNIAFEVDKEGHHNWVFHPPRKPASTSSSPAVIGGRVTPARLIIRRGTASYFDQRNGKRYAASDVDMTVSMPNAAGPVDADGSITWNGEKVTIDASLASPGTLRDGGASEASLRIASEPLKLTFRGEVTGGKAQSAAGVIDLDAPVARNLLAWLELRSAASRGGSGPLSVKGRIEIAGSKVSLTESDITLDSASARGWLALDDRGHPALSGQLDVKNLDVAPYLEHRAWSSSNSTPTPSSGSTIAPEPNATPSATTKEPGSSPAAAPTTASAPPSGASSTASPTPPTVSPSTWSSARFDLALLKRFDAALKINAASLRWRDFHLDKAAIDLRLAGGKLELELPEVKLYGGTGSGMVAVDAANATPAFAARADLHGVTVQPLFHDLADVDQLNGSGDIGLALEGNGGSPDELVASLAGTVSIGLKKGAVGSSVSQRLVQTIIGPFASKKRVRKFSEFDTLTATGTIQDGVLRNNDLTLMSPGTSVTGEGAVELRRREIDYTAVLDTGGINARITITGPWDDPSYKAQSVSIAPGSSRHLGKLHELLNPNR